MGPYIEGTSSFAEHLALHAPELLPDFTGVAGLELEHGTTIVAATYAEGVIIAGDRRSTMGNMIAKRDVRKVFRTDEYSAAGVAGTWNIAIELMRLFQVELEHYEKLEGRPLSLAGKANRLATMIRGNLAAAMQGLVVVPLFVGYDEDTQMGRIFSYDPAGGPSEEHQFHSIGSGSVFARGSLKKLYTQNMPVRDAALACVQALYDAADDDSATGGPDLARQLFPVIATVTGDGFAWVPDEESEQYARTVVEERLRSPDGPRAPLALWRRDPAQYRSHHRRRVDEQDPLDHRVARQVDPRHRADMQGRHGIWGTSTRIRSLTRGGGLTSRQQRSSVRDFERMLAALDSADLAAVHGQLSPLLVWGTGYPPFGLSWAYQLRDLIPGVREVVEVDRAKVFFPDERPEDLVAHLRRYWAC